jgi:lysozyme
MNLKMGNAGLALTMQFEGCKLMAYQDSVGVWTIGYGHTGNVKAGDTITESQAEDFLKADLATAERNVNSQIMGELTQNQFDALVDFTFNLGGGALAGSTLRKMLNAGDYEGAAKEFLRWNKAGGRVLPGLTRRRQAEVDLFNTK